MKSSTQRVVFFDLDGTLHQQDMFGSFLRYLLRHLPLNLLLVVPMGPVILAGLAVSGRAARWPMSLLLWATTFGRREAVLKRLEASGAVDSYRREHNGRLRKYYHLTEAGRKLIDDFLSEWAEISKVYEFIREDHHE